MADFFDLEEQREAEEKIISYLKKNNPILLKSIDFDSEGSAFVAKSANKDSIFELARIINIIKAGK
ncbi:MAG: Imm51 family immunity protein [Candidatus Omnitrophota bacterium]